jgi:hypothetical protein
MNTSVHKEIQQNEHIWKQNNSSFCWIVLFTEVFILLNSFVFRCSFCWIVLFTEVFMLFNCFVYRGVHLVELFCLQMCSFCWISLCTEVFMLLNCFFQRCSFCWIVLFTDIFILQVNQMHTTVNKTIKQHEHLCKQNNSTKWTPENKAIQQNEHLCKQNNSTKWTHLYTKQFNKMNIDWLKIQWNLSKQNLIGTSFFVHNRQVFCLYRLN